MNPTMERLIASTAETWSYLKEPHQASGACSDMTWRFQCVASEAGMQVQALRCFDYMFTWDTDCTRYMDHWVCLFEGYVIDWTARQFWQGSIFPWVEPLRTFHDKWRRIETDKGLAVA
jgi:hypothetical protein